MWYWSVPEGNYSRIVAVSLLLGWLLQGCGDWRIGRSRGVAFALIGYWVWGSIGAALAPVPDLSLRFVESIAKIVLPFLVGITTICSVRQLKQLAWVSALSEGYVAFEFNLSYYHGYNRVYEELFGGMDNNCIAVAMVSCTGLAFFLGLRARFCHDLSVNRAAERQRTRQHETHRQSSARPGCPNRSKRSFDDA